MFSLFLQPPAGQDTSWKDIRKILGEGTSIWNPYNNSIEEVNILMWGHFIPSP